MIIFNISSFVFYPFLLFAYLSFSNPKLLSVYILGLMITLSTNIIKKGCITLFPNSKFCLRPSTAVDCNIWNTGGNAANKPGFPSGHVTTISFFTFAAIHYYGLNNIYSLSLVISLILVCYGRRYCHTPLQIVSGLIYGGVLGYLFAT